MPKKKKQGSSWFPWRRAAPEMSSLKTEPPVTSVSATAILETEDQTSKKVSNAYVREQLLYILLLPLPM